MEDDINEVAAENASEEESSSQQSVGHSVNLLLNGSFESPDMGNARWRGYDAIEGWTSIEGGTLEIWRNNLGIEGSDGAQYVELDYFGNDDGFYQDVATAAGQDYTLSFDARLRQAAEASSQQIEVLWNGEVVATLQPGTTDWEGFSVTVTGTGGEDRLTLREPEGTGGDGLGALIDNIALVAEGDPVDPDPVNVIVGTDASDLIYGTEGNDDISGLSDNDFIIGGPGDDTINGGEGTLDIAVYGSSQHRQFVTEEVIINLEIGDVVNDGHGTSDVLLGVERVIIASQFDDVVFGSAGHDDLVIRGAGDDQVALGQGNDTLYIGQTQGRYDGGQGFDYLSLTHDFFVEGEDGSYTQIQRTDAQGVSVDLSRELILNDGLGNSAALTRFEGLVATRYNDILIGNDEVNAISDLDGDDIIDLGGGADSYIASLGADNITLGEGEDNIFYTGPEQLIGDVVEDFETGDEIYIETPNGALGNWNAAPTYINESQFSGTAGEVRFYRTENSLIFEVDNDGDGVSDGELTLRNAGEFIVLPIGSPASGFRIVGVDGENTAPSVNGDGATVESGGSVIIDVLANDFDIDGDELTVSIIAGFDVLPGDTVSLANGTVTLNFDGTLTFTPAEGITGEVQFGYAAFDGTDAAGGAVSITVTEPDPEPGVNLLLNGSFESPDMGNARWRGYDAIEGWTSIEGGTLEIWRNNLGIEGSDGAQYVELDYFGNDDGFYQDVATAPGQDYTLSFDARLRQAAEASSQQVEVLWNGEVVATLQPGTTDWEGFSVTITGTGGEDRLTLREPEGTGGDGLGALIDNVALVAEGDPVDPDPVNVIVGTDVGETLVGTDGNDDVSGLDGIDYLVGRQGKDILRGGESYDIAIYGDAFYEDGNTEAIQVDLALNIAQNDGHGFQDVLESIEGVGIVSEYDDVVLGSDQGDLVWFYGGGDNYADLGAGNDTLHIDQATGIYVGGEGTDLLHFLDTYLTYDENGVQTFTNRTGGVHVDLASQQIIDDGLGNTGTVIGFERVEGTEFDDVLIGDEGANQIFDREGNDVIDFRGGEDYYYGADGEDILTLGAGSDYVTYSAASSLIGDVITDFQTNDGIFINGDAFTEDGRAQFVGSSEFNGVAGEVIAVRDGLDLQIHVDVDGDGESDGFLTLQGVRSVSVRFSNQHNFEFSLEEANFAPIARMDYGFGVAEEIIIVDVLENDTDQNDDALTITHVDGQAVALGGTISLSSGEGSVTLNLDGTLSFVAPAGDDRTVEFSYTVSDGLQTSKSTVDVSIFSEQPNNPPAAYGDNVTVVGGESVIIDVIDNDTDVDGDTLSVSRIAGRDVNPGDTVTLSSGEGNIRLNLDGTLTFTPADGVRGNVEFNYAASDGVATSDALVSITVTEPDPEPGVNLLLNGSFESPDMGNARWRGYDTIEGWTSIEGGTLEIWRNNLGIEGSDGAQYVELDYFGNDDGFYQDVATAAGQDYTLSFDARLRQAADASSQQVEVLWNGEVVATLQPGTTVWEGFSVTVTGTGGEDRLTLREPEGTGGDGLGALIDNVALVAEGGGQSAELAKVQGAFISSMAEGEAVFDFEMLPKAQGTAVMQHVLMAPKDDSPNAIYANDIIEGNQSSYNDLMEVFILEDESNFDFM